MGLGALVCQSNVSAFFTLIATGSATTKVSIDTTTTPATLPGTSLQVLSASDLHVTVVTSTHDYLLIAWTTPSPVPGYLSPLSYIVSRTSAGDTTIICADVSTPLNCVDLSGTAGASYTYVVTSINGSSESSVTTGPITYPS